MAAEDEADTYEHVMLSVFFNCEFAFICFVCDVVGYFKQLRRQYC